MLSTVARTGKLLAIFTEDSPQWGVREAAAALDWPKSNTHEMLASLAGIGLLQRTSDSKYRLGWRLLSLSRTLLQSSTLEFHAKSVAFELSLSIRQPVTVGIWDGRRVICVASFGGTPQGATFASGSRLPGHSSALGKILMSSLDESEVDWCVERFGLPRLTNRTNTKESVFREQLEEARARNIAFDSGESISDRYCISAPVTGASADVVAAISISATAEAMRSHEPRFSVAIKGAAKRLSAYQTASNLEQKFTENFPALR